MSARGVWACATSWAYRLCLGAEGYRILVPWLLLCDGLLTALIVQRVPYTEIDFTTYVGQARLFLEGERVYTRLDPVNGSGPCVYPAGHLYAYAALASLSKGASDLVPAQLLFGALYLATFALVAQLYRLAGAPPILLVFLVLSKRLHSIFVLRMFNDPVCMFWVYGSIYLLCARRWRLACVVYSLGLSVKMSALLFLPGLCVVLFRALGAAQTLVSLAIIVGVQVVLGAPFLLADWRAYVSSAFDFSRVFLYKWTVNWRFLDEATFLKARTARVLLGVHAALLAAFGLFRWTGIGNQGMSWVKRRWNGELM
ncbi:dolichyl-P-Man:Man5GlcNAc2-PP-dolichol alpha-1,3-mannosyltransferase [Malassezia brasiliensis]|uniref:Dol-P-Man:Man(5)GlcNAc(2)-PP-Dol alpha-1,3-mannosyltransferase n=1 Tax=Malassezia brasiliensis TaxID=1821822 RepID=A0AAF0DYW8_9BASI|nr:dolichyl-P-Man:Man5GlcNAc2-PP-dolichol alpha-1,3-mannosyltransferase [Malassezia brasiliensis]